MVEQKPKKYKIVESHVDPLENDMHQATETLSEKDFQKIYKLFNPKYKGKNIMYLFKDDIKKIPFVDLDIDFDDPDNSIIIDSADKPKRITVGSILKLVLIFEFYDYEFGNLKLPIGYTIIRVA